MTSNPDDAPGSSAVLRAIASLLMALGQQGGQRPLPDEPTMSRRTSPPGASEWPPTPSPAQEPARPARTPDDFASMIEEARERAQRVLDQGVERARALSQATAALAPAAGTDPEAARQIDELRRAMALMSNDLREVQQRLARIESLLREWPRLDAPAPAAAPRATVAPPPPAPAAPAPPVAPPAYVAPSPPPPPPVVAASPAPPPPAPPRWAEPPAGLPQSAVPPMRAPQALPPIPEPLAPSPPPPPVAPVFAAQPAPPPVVAPPSPPVPPAPRPAPPTAQGAPPAGVTGPESSEAPLATFVPEDGSVLVRVAPVAGFQGLMRVQDALARLRGIRQTAVEAYSQGEARLRLEIGEVTDSDEIAGGLAGTLSVPVQVREVSEAERSMLIVLG